MELKGSKTEANLWKAFAGESQARNKYTYFASQARKEGYEQIAAIFEETAGNEKEHAKLWFKALGGICTTAENLLAAALEGRGLINLRFAPYQLTAEAEADLKANARGYIFQQSVDGVTGPQSTTSPQVGVNVARLKSLGITTPVVAGFGISNARQVGEMRAMGADGVIVGSAILSAILAGNGEAFIKSLREALA